MEKLFKADTFFEDMPWAIEGHIEVRRTGWDTNSYRVNVGEGSAWATMVSLHSKADYSLGGVNGQEVGPLAGRRVALDHDLKLVEPRPLAEHLGIHPDNLCHGVDQNKG